MAAFLKTIQKRIQSHQPWACLQCLQLCSANLLLRISSNCYYYCYYPLSPFPLTSICFQRLRGGGGPIVVSGSFLWATDMHTENFDDGLLNLVTLSASNNGHIPTATQPADNKMPSRVRAFGFRRCSGRQKHCILAFQKWWDDRFQVLLGLAWERRHDWLGKASQRAGWVILFQAQKFSMHKVSFLH